METTPFPSSASSSIPFFKKQHQQHLITSSSFSNPSSPLCPLPKNQEVSIPIPSSSFNDFLIGDVDPPSQTTQTPPPPPSSSEEDAVDPIWLLSSKPKNLHRSRTAPAILDALSPSSSNPSPPSLSRPRCPSILRNSIILLSIYLVLGVAIYCFFTSHFSGKETHPVVDALYFCIVTMCTIGYGDITPNTPFAKIFSITFVLFGFGFIDILLSSMLSYVLDLQESLLLASIRNKNYCRNNNCLVDVKKGRMRIRMKVGLALAVLLFCIGVGTGVLRFLERLGWLDSFYLSVMSVTTVGYGDRTFKTMSGRLFASVWLLVSTLAVARAFLYLAEARMDERHMKFANWVLARDMTVSEFLAADIDNNGSVSKSEFVIYKLKEMGKIAEKDILQICDHFDKLDTANCGKITLSDLTKGHHN